MQLIHLLKDRNKRRRFAHIAAGIVILIHAYEKYENGHSSYKLFVVAAIVFLTVALLHPIIERRAPWIDGVFLVIEGFLSVIIAYDFFHLGKKALPVAYLLLSLFQFFMAFRKGKKAVQHHKTNHH